MKFIRPIQSIQKLFFIFSILVLLSMLCGCNSGVTGTITEPEPPEPHVIFEVENTTTDPLVVNIGRIINYDFPSVSTRITLDTETIQPGFTQIFTYDHGGWYWVELWHIDSYSLASNHREQYIDCQNVGKFPIVNYVSVDSWAVGE